MFETTFRKSFMSYLFRWNNVRYQTKTLGHGYLNRGYFSILRSRKREHFTKKSYLIKTMKIKAAASLLILIWTGKNLSPLITSRCKEKIHTNSKRQSDNDNKISMDVLGKMTFGHFFSDRCITGIVSWKENNSCYVINLKKTLKKCQILVCQARPMTYTSLKLW